MNAAAAPRNPTWMTIVGWVITVVVAAGLAFSSSFKLREIPPEVAKDIQALGWSIEQMPLVGVLELSSALVYLVPQTAVLGGVLLTGYLGGAVATHVRIEDGNFPGALIGGALVWLGLFFRDPRIRALLPYRWPLSPNKS